MLKILAAILFLLAAALGGCSDSPLPTSSASSYLGAWSSTTGTSTIACPGQAAMVDPVTSRITFGQGLTAGELLEANGSCVTTFELYADGLQALAGHTCWDRTRPDITLVVDGETFTSSDSLHAVDLARGRVLFDGVGGAPCSWAGELYYYRVGP